MLICLVDVLLADWGGLTLPSKIHSFSGKGMPHDRVRRKEARTTGKLVHVSRSCMHTKEIQLLDGNLSG